MSIAGQVNDYIRSQGGYDALRRKWGIRSASQIRARVAFIVRDPQERATQTYAATQEGRARAASEAAASQVAEARGQDSSDPEIVRRTEAELAGTSQQLQFQQATAGREVTVDTDRTRAEALIRERGITPGVQQVSIAIDRQGIKKSAQELGRAGIKTAPQLVGAAQRYVAYREAGGYINRNGRDGVVSGSRTNTREPDNGRYINSGVVEGYRATQESTQTQRQQTRTDTPRPQVNIKPVPTINVLEPSKPKRFNLPDYLGRKASDFEQKSYTVGGDAPLYRAGAFLLGALETPARAVTNPVGFVKQTVEGVATFVTNPKQGIASFQESFRQEPYKVSGQVTSDLIIGAKGPSAAVFTVKKFRQIGNVKIRIDTSPTQATYTRELQSTVLKGYELPESGNIFEPRVKYRQTVLAVGGRDPVTNIPPRPVEDFIRVKPITERTSADIPKDQTMLFRYGYKRPLAPDVEDILRAKTNVKGLTVQTFLDAPPTNVNEIIITRKGFVGKRAQRAVSTFGSYRNIGSPFTIRVVRTPIRNVRPSSTSFNRLPRRIFIPLFSSSNALSSQRSISNLSSTIISQGDGLDSSNIVTPRLKDFNITRTDTRSITATDYALRSASAQQYRYVTSTSFREFNNFRNFYGNRRYTEKKRFIPPVPGANKETDKVARFDVFVRRFGKDVKINTSQFNTLGEAKTRLKSELVGTARASGFITSRGTKVRIGSLGAGFRTSKSDPFRVVQKRGFRIRSGGELREITYKGIRSGKR